MKDEEEGNTRAHRALPNTRTRTETSAPTENEKRAPDRPAAPSPRRCAARPWLTTSGRKPPPVWRVPDVLVSSSVRKSILRAVPRLARDRASRALVAHAVAGTARDATTKRPLLAAGIVAEFAEQRASYEAKNFRARAQLQTIRDRTLPGLEWSEPTWSPDGGACRALTDLGIDCGVLDAFERDLRIRPDHIVQPVGFVSGSAFGRRSRERMRLDSRSAAHVSSDARPASARVARYLNTIPPNLFSKTLGNLGRAYDAADTIRDVARRHHAYRVLRAVAVQPQPFYSAKSKFRTARVCAVGTSVLSLPREVRAVVTRDWVPLDLRAVQLAIVARDWKVAPLADFLDGDGDIWAELVGALDPSRSWTPKADGYGELKAVAKGFVYASVFGMGVRRLSALGGEDFAEARNTVREVLGIEPECAGRRLRAHPLIAAVLRARAPVYADIVRAGGTHDCFGVWLPCPSRGRASSVAALLAQSTELRLMLPVIEMAEREEERAAERGRAPDWRVAAWLHDGCWINTTNRSKAERHIARIRSAVDDHACGLGYATRLDVG